MKNKTTEAAPTGTAIIEAQLSKSALDEATKLWHETVASTIDTAFKIVGECMPAPTPPYVNDRHVDGSFGFELEKTSKEIPYWVTVNQHGKPTSFHRDVDIQVSIGSHGFLKTLRARWIANKQAELLEAKVKTLLASVGL